MLSSPVFAVTHSRPFFALPFTAVCTLYRFPCPITRIPRLHNSFRMNTCKNVSKQATLTISRMNTYEKHRGWGAVIVNQLPPEFDVQTLRRSDVATFPRSDALLVRSFHSFTKECLRTLLQPTRSALFLKTAGCVGTEGSIRSSLFIRLVLFCLPAAARAAITTKPLRSCNIQWRTAQG
jgi:hypothetical protein